MVKIRHNKTREVRNITRYDWENKLEYKHNQGAWTVVNPGDPVMLMEVLSTGDHREWWVLDRDHAERMMRNNPRQKYYYLEVEREDSKRTSFRFPKVTIGRQQQDNAPQVKPQYEVKPTSDSKYTMWDKIKHIGAILGAIGTILTVLQQCAG